MVYKCALTDATVCLLNFATELDNSEQFSHSKTELDHLMYNIHLKRSKDIDFFYFRTVSNVKRIERSFQMLVSD